MGGGAGRDDGAARRLGFAAAGGCTFQAVDRPSSTFSARRPRRPSSRRTWSPSLATTSRKSTGAGPPGGCSRSNGCPGIKLNDRDALIAEGHDCKALRRPWSAAFLRQAIVDGFFHADLHHGNLFALPDGRVAAIDFGIMGRIDRRARVWLAEILYGLITGNYRRVAEIHFEAQYVPAHHSVQEFATALRAAGEPIRGLPVKDISVGRMLESLFAITRDFDMPTQPHLLLLQKSMVMNEGVATRLDPDINMWETAEPFLREWMRSELGPEAYYADRIVETVRAIKKIPT
jgi:ubiquinone biosynthesis protein